MILTSFDHCTRLLSYEATVLHLDDQDPGQTRASPRTAEKMTLQLCCGMERKLSCDSHPYKRYCTELLNVRPLPCMLLNHFKNIKSRLHLNLTHQFLAYCHRFNSSLVAFSDGFRHGFSKSESLWYVS